nr:tetratricopeptide repeat protein [Methylomarinum sp. Ch1-1]MDP4522697.1 tetratricopeptide repeat protein [Methylomarinum sp. Ch1-1]
MMRVILFFLCCVISLSLLAADQEKSATVSPWLYKKLTKAEKLIEQKSYSSAQRDLQKLLGEVDQGSYEQAAVLRSLSSVHALQGQYGKAAQLLKQCLALQVLPEQQEQQAILNLGQLYMASEQYALAVKTLQPWLAKNPKPDAELSALLANAYAQLKQYRQALPHIKRAIAASNKPSESWYQLNLALYYELNDYASAATLLNRLLNRYPQKKNTGSNFLPFTSN